MKNFLFRDLLKQSWYWSWRNKKLWWLGFFAGGGEIVYNVMQKTSAASPSDVVGKVVAYSLLFVFAIILIAAVFIVLSSWARAGLLQGIKQEKEGGAYELRQLLGFGSKKIGRLILIELLMLVPAAILVIPIAFYFFSKAHVILTILFALFALALLVYFALRAFAKHYVYCFAVLEDQPAWTAIVSGWQLFKNNFWTLVGAGALQIVLRLLTGIAVLIVVSVTALPFVLIGVALTVVAGETALFGLMLIGIIVAAAAFCILHGACSVYFNKFLTEIYWEVRKTADQPAIDVQ